MNNRTTAICYVRKSLVRPAGAGGASTSSADPASPEMQRRALEELAARLRLRTEFYEDADGHRSGKSDAHRPGWQAARARLDDPDVGALLVYSFGRAFRNVKLLLGLVDDLQGRGVRIVSLKDNIDPQTSRGRMMLTFVAAFDEGESNEASERRVETIDFLRRKRGRHYGTAPFGTERVAEDGERVLRPSTKTQPNGTDFEALAACYKMHAEGRHSIRWIARELNRAGWRFRGRDGALKEWRHEHVHMVLRSHWLYAGYVTIGRAYRGEFEVIKGSHKALLPERLTRAAAARFAGRRAGPAPRRQVSAIYPLSGLVYCACGQKMPGSVIKDVRRYRHTTFCERHLCFDISADVIEQAVRERIAGLRLPAALTAETDDAILRVLAAEESGTSAQAERDRLADSLARLKDLYVSREMDRAEYDARKAELLAQMPAAPRRGAPAGALLALGNLRASVRECPPMQLRALAGALYERIVVLNRSRRLRFVARGWCRRWA